MKTLFKMMALFALLFTITSCGDDDEVALNPTRDVNYANLAGTWYLSEWNGEKMNDTRYYYITFNRKEVDGKRKYEIYTNYNSAFSEKITGAFLLKKEADFGDVITGTYDFQLSTDDGWPHDYSITEMYENSMVWTATDDADEVRVYTRCSEVPEDIVKGTRSLR